MKKPVLPATPAPSPAPPAVSVGQLALRFGVAGGILCAGWMLILLATGSNPFGPKQLLAQIIVPMLAVAAQWRLRQRLAPERAGIGRQFTLGGLVVLLAAGITASSVVGLADGAGHDKLLTMTRQETLEIMRADMQARPKSQRDPAQEQQQLTALQQLSVADIAVNIFTKTLLLGLALAVPGGIFFRE